MKSQVVFLWANQREVVFENYVEPGVFPLTSSSFFLN